jgi:hypothetical protein
MIDPSQSIFDVSCATSSFCVAVDAWGQEVMYR